MNTETQVTEQFVRWMTQQPVKVQEQHIACMTSRQLTDFFRIGCRIFT
jgi:hypothetical protein